MEIVNDNQEKITNAEGKYNTIQYFKCILCYNSGWINKVKTVQPVNNDKRGQYSWLVDITEFEDKE